MVRFLRPALALCLLTTAGPASAQSPFSAELRAGVAVPAEDFGDTDLDSGYALGATLRYQLPLCLSVYAGWDRVHFSGDGGDLEDTGYMLGLRWTPVRLERFFGPWLLAGALYKHVEIENDDGDLVADSDHAPGWEAGAGLTFPLSPRLSLTPGVRYRTFASDIEGGGLAIEDVDLSYFAFEVGLAFEF